jgi:cytochrome c biogenesis protein CcdA
MNAVVFAFGAGVLATVNPCGFVMLPAFLSFYLGGGSPDRPGESGAGLLARVGHGFVVGVAVSAGFAGVFTAAGLLISLGLRVLTQAMPWAALVIGGVLTVAGVAVAAGRQIGPRLVTGMRAGPDGDRGGRGVRAMVAFGAAYAIASLSCTLAVLVAVVAQASTTANPAQTVMAFAAYAAGSTTILVVFAVAAALTNAALARIMRRVLPVVTRAGGLVLAGSGLYLIAYWLPALTGGGPNNSVAAVTNGPSAVLTRFLDTHQVLIGAVTAPLLAAGIAVSIVSRRRRAGRDAAHGSADDTGCCPPDQVSASASGGGEIVETRGGVQR